MTGALVLDFGGPVLRTPFELFHLAESDLGLPDGTFWRRGPFDPDADDEWRAMQAQEITEPQYWENRAASYMQRTGNTDGLQGFMGRMYDREESALVRPEARAAIAATKAAGIKVGVLTNDLTAFHDQAWIDHMTILREFDVLVDAKRDGVRKPQPEAYNLVLERLGATARESVFVDDQPLNLRGAEAVGLHAVFLDVREPARAYDEALRFLAV